MKKSLVKAIAETPWAIRPSKLAVILDLVRAHADAGELTRDEVVARLDAGLGGPQPERRGDIQVLPLWGVILPKPDMFSALFGDTPVSAFRVGFRQALADPQVGAILIDIDSPGGQVDQVPELAAEIRAARGTKPIVAIANTYAASAAYWLGSQADQLVVTPSGEVGSIGVFSAHDDISQLLEMEGEKITLISAGKYKVEGNPFEPLSDEARGEFQREVDEYYGMFITDVAAARGVSAADVIDNYGQGRMLTAKRALKAGMVDGIETFDQALRRTMSLALGSGIGAQGRRASAAPVVPDSDSSDGPENRPSYADHAQAVLAVVTAFVQRTRERKAGRASQNRGLGAGVRPLLVSVREELEAARAELDELLVEKLSVNREALVEFARSEEIASHLIALPD